MKTQSAFRLFILLVAANVMISFILVSNSNSVADSHHMNPVSLAVGLHDSHSTKMNANAGAESEYEAFKQEVQVQSPDGKAGESKTGYSETIFEHAHSASTGMKYDEVVQDTDSLHQQQQQKHIVRYDKISSQLKNNYGRVHQLSSIPPKRRMVPGTYEGYTIPHDATRNLTYFLESRERIDDEERPLFLYNPSLLSLDEGKISQQMIDNLSIEGGAKASYIATFRVSNFGNCHGPGRGVPESYRNYIGIALLDEHLNILQHDGQFYEVVIDLNTHFYGYNTGQKLNDCQVYTVLSKERNGWNKLLMLQCDEYAFPVSLRVVDGEPSNENDVMDRFVWSWFRREDTPVKRQDKKSHGKTIPNMYGTKLQLTPLQRPSEVWQNHDKKGVIKGAKNMHHFGPGYMEIWPSAPHEFIRVMYSKKRISTSHIMRAPRPEPDPSFPTKEYTSPRGDHTVFTPRDSGSACCVPVEWIDDAQQTQTLLLGFSHRKTKKRPKRLKDPDMYSYISRVYAFEPHPPFNIVARSGFFCLGFANPDDESHQSTNEQVFGATIDYKLTIQNDVYECPRIHFISGITEKIGDPEIVIVSYGVNDCYPRMVEVEKKFLIALLKGEGLD